MLAEDVEVFEYVPYRFDGKPMFAKHVNEAYEGNGAKIRIAYAEDGGE